MDMQFVAETPRERVLEVIAASQACWLKGDIEGVLANAVADLRFRTSYRETYPNGFEAVGRDACRQAFREMLTEIEPLGTEFQRIVVDGPRLALWRIANIRKRGTGSRIALPVCNFCTLRDGMVSEYFEFTDIDALRTLEDGHKGAEARARRSRQVPFVDGMPLRSRGQGPSGNSGVSAAFRRDVIEQAIRLLYGRRSADNFATVEEFLAPDVAFRCNSWLGQNRFVEYRGIENCFSAFREHTIFVEHLGNTIHEILIDGEQAAIRRTARLRNRGGGDVVDVDICNFFAFRDGRIVEMEEFPDTDAIRRLGDIG